jgi:hypothetical protein
MALRPKPPLRFFIGRMKPEERTVKPETMSDMEM